MGTAPGFRRALALFGRVRVRVRARVRVRVRVRYPVHTLCL